VGLAARQKGAKATKPAGPMLDEPNGLEAGRRSGFLSVDLARGYNPKRWGWAASGIEDGLKRLRNRTEEAEEGRSVERNVRICQLRNKLMDETRQPIEITGVD